MFRRNTEKYITITVLIEKEVTRINKNGEEVAKNMSYILLTVQSLWQVHYQILSIIFLKEFIELNVNSDNVKHVELNISIKSIFWNTQILKTI